jgi:hypothetical protein
LGFVYVRESSSLSSYVLGAYLAGGGGDVVGGGGQGSYPIHTSPTGELTFDYTFTQATDYGTTLRLIGYY